MFTALTIDYETRSKVNLKQASYRRYASHESTGVLCVATQFVEQPEAEVFIPKYANAVFQPGVDECPAPIVYAIQNNIPIYAHNAFFDARIHHNHCHRVLGWPDIPRHLWRCSMSLCSYYALPRSLAAAGEALELPVQKSMDGHNVMMQLAKPRTVTKRTLEKLSTIGVAEEDLESDWYEDVQRLYANAEYCRQDVETQTALLRKLGPLPEPRLLSWQRDWEINERGVRLDVISLLTTQAIVKREAESKNKRIREVTTGITGVPMVLSVNQRDQILRYLEMQGINLVSLTKADVETALDRPDLGTTAREVLELRRQASKSSINKIKAMLNHIDTDGRARDSMVWHKATTGRWAGRAWQPHNFPRNAMKEKDAEEFHRALRQENDPVGFYAEKTLGSRDDFFAILSSALRSYIIAPEGGSLLVSDFSAIESRILAWVSGCKKLLQAYHEKRCVYSMFASKVFRRDITEKGPERQLGKIAVLGLGYGMGEDTFISTADKDPTVPDTSELEWTDQWEWKTRSMQRVLVTKAKMIVNLYRNEYPEVPKLWKDYEASMVTAIETQSSVRCGWVTFGANEDWAWIVLPSGRPLWYYSPAVEVRENRWGKRQKTITHMRQMSQNGGKWVRRPTWGGTLTENVVQAIAADLLDAAIYRIDLTRRYQTILTVHDEVVAEKLPKGTKEEFHELMKVVPDWAPGCPVDAETGEHQRYGK